MAGLLEFMMTRGQRKQDYEIKKAQEERAQKQFDIEYGMEGQPGLEQRKVEIDQKTLDYRNSQLTEQLNQWDKENKIKRRSNEIHEIAAWSGVFNETMARYPEKAQEIYDLGLKKYYGPAKLDMHETGDWSVKMEDGTAFIIDKKTGKFKTAQYGLGSIGKVKMSDVKSGLLSILTKYKSAGSSLYDLESEEGQNSYRNLRDAAQNPEHPQHEEAKADYIDYMAIENRLREIMGLQGRELPSPKPMGNLETMRHNRLQNVGQPIGAAPQGKPLDRETAAYFLQQADGDPERARQMAREQGYTF